MHGSSRSKSNLYKFNAILIQCNLNLILRNHTSQPPLKKQLGCQLQIQSLQKNQREIKIAEK